MGQADGMQLVEWTPGGGTGVEWATQEKQLQCAVSPQGVGAASNVVQTHHFGSSAGIFANHVTTQQPRCLA